MDQEKFMPEVEEGITPIEARTARKNYTGAVPYWYVLISGKLLGQADVVRQSFGFCKHDMTILMLEFLVHNHELLREWMQDHYFDETLFIQFIPPRMHKARILKHESITRNKGDSSPTLVPYKHKLKEDRTNVTKRKYYRESKKSKKSSPQAKA